MSPIVVPLAVAIIAVTGTLLTERWRAAVARRGQDVDVATATADQQLDRDNYGLDVLQASLGELHRKTDAQGAEIAVLSERLDQCETDKHELRDEIEGMSEANRQMRVAVDESRDDRQRLGRRVSDLTTQLAELRRNVAGQHQGEQ